MDAEKRVRELEARLRETEMRLNSAANSPPPAPPKLPPKAARSSPLAPVKESSMPSTEEEKASTPVVSEKNGPRLSAEPTRETVGALQDCGGLAGSFSRLPLDNNISNDAISLPPQPLNSTRSNLLSPVNESSISLTASLEQKKMSETVSSEKNGQKLSNEQAGETVGLRKLLST